MRAPLSRVPFTSRTFGQKASPDLAANERPMPRMRPPHIMLNGHGDPTGGDEMDAMAAAHDADRADRLARKDEIDAACAATLEEVTKRASPDAKRTP